MDSTGWIETCHQYSGGFAKGRCKERRSRGEGSSPQNCVFETPKMAGLRALPWLKSQVSNNLAFYSGWGQLTVPRVGTNATMLGY